MENKKVYLDNAATTQTAPEVLEAMLPFFSQNYGNASSFHFFGRQAKAALDEARIDTAKLLNASPEEIFFTGCGSEADNIAIFGTLAKAQKKGHIITSKIEHHAVLYSCQELQKRGFEVTYLDVDKGGVVSVEHLKNSLKEDTLLVSIMHANNEIGTIQPIVEISKILKNVNKNKKNPIYFHSDAVQSAGKIKLDVKELGVDLLSLAAHKFNGPKGVGALYVRKGTFIFPVMFGGHHENGLRPGTENIASIIGFSKALELSNSRIAVTHKKNLILREKLKDGILNSIPDTIINGSGHNSISCILNVSFKFIEGESLLLRLDMKGIAASAGSACATGSAEPSHVLSAIGLDAVSAQGSVRFSFGFYNTQEDVDYVLKVLPDIVESLRSMSPVYKKTSNSY
ncbi:MAG: cysteine desulfurase NifS [Elusimicrobiota bacterium]|jgi:cysteine desulfurase|nr:cysteine desulfurase NifS [Elusimicrobiota bacterium]